MSSYPRIVQSDTWVTWGGNRTFVRRRTMVDVKPGSALETAYGGPSNLSAVVPFSQMGNDTVASHAGISN